MAKRVQRDRGGLTAPLFPERRKPGKTPRSRIRSICGLQILAAGLALVLLGGCREDMQNQPRYKPFRPSPFFADDDSSRPMVPGTVARGELRTDRYFYSGFVGKSAGDYMPFPVTKAVLERGRERFNIYCAPCHARAGDGNGMIVQRGFRRPPSYHTDRLRNAPLGHFYDVITNGFGAMPDYSAQIEPRDRWMIVAYIRALQLSQYAPASLLPAGTSLPPPPPVPGTPGSGATPAQAAPQSGNLQAGQGAPSTVQQRATEEQKQRKEKAQKVEQR